MKLIINEHEYEVDRINLSTNFINGEEENQDKLKQDLSITVKDGNIANEINLTTIESLKNNIAIITSDNKQINFENFQFVSFDVYIDATTERFELRFNKIEEQEIIEENN